MTKIDYSIFEVHHQKHIAGANAEYKYYFSNRKRVANEYKKKHKNGLLARGKTRSTMHLSIDAMTQINLPVFGQSHTPNAIYFQRKLGATPMGIFNEGSGKGITYLYDITFGSTRSSHVISLIDYYIKKSSSTAKTLVLNFDNCAVNKNYLVSYNEVNLTSCDIYSYKIFIWFFYDYRWLHLLDILFLLVDSER